MKGIILAGGKGSRLYPLTYATNKHLLPIYDMPMIFYPIKTLVSAGIKEILIVTGGPHAGHFMRVLKNGEDLGIKHLEYAYQEVEGGISHALALAKDFSDNEPVTVILGDNCTDANIKKDVESFKKGAMIFLKEVLDPERYGVAKFNNNGELIEIVEKPGKVSPGPIPSNFAATGLYIFDGTFHKKIG